MEYRTEYKPCILTNLILTYFEKMIQININLFDTIVLRQFEIVNYCTESLKQNLYFRSGHISCRENSNISVDVFYYQA